MRCIPSEKVEERLTRSIAKLSDQVTTRCIPSEKVEERLTRSITNLSEQFQQFRVREDANTSTGRITNVAVERLELLIKQARHDFEAQLVTHRQDVKTQLQECSRELHQHVNDIKIETTRKVADEKWDMTQKVRTLEQKNPSLWTSYCSEE